MRNEIKDHWEAIYNTRQPNEVSWMQEKPEISLQYIYSFNLPKTARIIDIGGGDSKLVDYLLADGFKDITVLDISETALKRAQARLGDKAASVKWIVSDITEFEPTDHYDAWHDRAVFHFLTSNTHIGKYLEIARKAVKGYLIIGTFSNNGPKRCSGLDIKQYSENDLENQFLNGFTKIKCSIENHITPFNTSQNFLFCSFKHT